MPSMLKNTCMTLAKNGLWPCMAQVTFVDSPFGSNVNSSMLLVSNGLTKIEVDPDLGRRRRVRNLHASRPGLAAAFPGIDGALAAAGAAVAALHRGIELLVRRPGHITTKVVDQREDLLRRRLDAGGALDTERVRLGRGQQQDGGDADHEQNDHDDGDCLEHRSLGCGCGSRNDCDQGGGASGRRPAISSWC